MGTIDIDSVVRPGAAGDRLRRSQDARRSRVLEAVLELLQEGGYDSLRVRDVWERSGVGTDTIYRYYGSRERLIAAAVGDWLEREFFAPASSWAVGATAAEQLLSMCRRTWEMWQRAPRMLEPFLRASLAEGVDADGLAARTRRSLIPLMVAALDGVDPEYRDDVILTVEGVSRAASFAVMGGELPLANAYPMVERTVRRLAQHPAMDGHRPDSMEYVGPTPETPGVQR